MDRHSIFAYLHTGVRVKITENLQWGHAQDQWLDLDDLRRECELSGRILTVGEYIGAVKFLAVRSTTDREWPQGQPEQSVVVV